MKCKAKRLLWTVQRKNVVDSCKGSSILLLFQIKYTLASLTFRLILIK